ncbi:penicillin-binding transpeptidase domain-containing protein, partial [Paracoccus thiocyanatus]|uniref:penicillin-binding transpeptidase domain-containing protein n=1 Tax=Paracoccus thiocyanatus TaxID=34006 RepID=UPI00216243D2
PPSARAAMAEPVPRVRRAFPALAPLLAARLMREHPGALRIETTIDPRLQRRAEALAARAVQGAGRRLSAAVVLADHRTGEILAEVGAADWTDGASAGFVDMTRAWRSPGSTLKPFVYGLAFDDGLAHPETLIEDRPTVFGRWQPQNFDHHFRGTVSLRNALIWSLNIPVVKLAEAVGPNRIAQALRRGGVDLRLPGDAPGLAVVLGGTGVTLEGLAQGYAALARGGRGITLSALPGGGEERAAAMFGAVAAWQVGHILAQNPAPHGARLRPLAYKTGTSYGHRDALAVGYDGAHVGAVWLGRPDGTPVPGAFGGDLAAPLLFDLFDALPAVALAPPPPQAADRGQQRPAFGPAPLFRAGRGQRRRRRRPGRAGCAAPDLSARRGRDRRPGRLAAKARGGRGPWTFLVNGAPVAIARPQPVASLPHPGPGFAEVTVLDALGASATAAIRLH